MLKQKKQIKNLKTVIAVLGMADSGKSETINYLSRQTDWPKIYFGAATFERLKKEGLKINYHNERLIREKIRAELGMGAYAKLAMPKIKQALKNSDTVILESLYSWAEYLILKKKFGPAFLTLAVYAPPAIRFKRLNSRDKERPIKSRREFQERDYSEIEKTDKGGPIAIADFTIINEGTCLDLRAKIARLIPKLRSLAKN